MRTRPLHPADLAGVFAVPPLARRRDARRGLDFEQNDRLVSHILEGGITRLVWGGNALLYHVTLEEYASLLAWMADLDDRIWAIPSVGPSYGRAIDQAPILRRYSFPAAMLLPCQDPRDAEGLETGVREIADATGIPVILYLKDERGFGPHLDAGLDAVGRLVDAGVVVAIKYAVVRRNPAADPYLDGLLARVNRRVVVSGMGERPAITHMQRFGLPGFTTGSGCVAPGLSQALFEACRHAEWDAAEQIRSTFLPLEDLRDAWGPAPVLHAAVALAGVAATGPIPPFVSEPNDVRRAAIGEAVGVLAAVEARPVPGGRA